MANSLNRGYPPKISNTAVYLTRCSLVSTAHRSILPYLRQLYEEAFPPCERRSWYDLELLIGGEEAYHFLLIEHIDLGVVGFVTLWHFSDFYYGEHFAIFPHLRNQHLGESTLSALRLYMGDIPLYIEVEPENISAIAMRRIAYYERNGFQIVKRDYLQPPYHPTDPTLSLYIMCSEKPLEEQVAYVCETIRAYVYPHF